MYFMKNVEAHKPIPKERYVIILYYSYLSDIAENITNPIPKTVKLLIKVKRLRRLLSLS